MDWISNPEVWTALATLTLLELVLGVDNVVFISILAAKLPAHQQDKARKVGLLAAAGMRILLLMVVGVIVSLKNDLFTLFGVGFSTKDLILLAGGAFLLYKATKEIHHRLEGEEAHGVVLVEMLNIRSRKRTEPVKLHEPYLERRNLSDPRADTGHPMD